MTHLSRTDHAAQWLTQQLSTGPKDHQWIEAHSPYSIATLKRARRRIGIVSRGMGQYPYRTTWELPQ